MNRKKILVGTGLITLVTTVIIALQVGSQFGVSTRTGAAIGVPSHTNVLVIIADDMGVDKLGAYAIDADPEYATTASWLPQTPILDSLADRGARFTDAWANPSCSPTRATLLTGTHAFRHGVGTPINPELELSDTTIAEAMSAAGYRAGLLGKWHLGEGDSLAHGEEWTDYVGEDIPATAPPIEHGFNFYAGNLWGQLNNNGYTGYSDWLQVSSIGTSATDSRVAEMTNHATQYQATRAIQWINLQQDPWLFVLALNAPHHPLENPPESCAYTSGEPSTDHERYRAMVECMDIEIGNLLKGIDDLDDTLIVFVGDNGTDLHVAEGVFDDGRGKATLYESGIRVPMIVTDGRSWLAEEPEYQKNQDWFHSTTWVAEPGMELADPVGVVDLFATFTEIAGASAASAVDSVSLVPLLGETQGDAPAFSYTELYRPEGTGSAALRKGAFKLIVSVSEQGGQNCRDGNELYNVVSDRFELEDISSSKPAILNNLMSELDELIATETGNWLDVEDCS